MKVQRKAAARNAEAQTQLALCNELENVGPSRAETIHWLSLAGEQRCVPAEYELGRIYLYGRGIPADYKTAMFWEEKAAQQGERKAQRDMALGTPGDRVIGRPGFPRTQLSYFWLHCATVGSN